MAAVHPQLESIESLEGPRGLPLIGSLFDIDFKVFHRRLEDWCEEFGPIFRIRIGPRKIVVVAGSDYNEAMRLKPEGPINAMEALEDVELMGYRIPKGTVIMLLTRHIAVDDAQFGDGSRFDPERWLMLDAERQCPHDTSAFIPFGTGPRFCPGRNLALLQIRTVLAMLCRNFDVRLADPNRPVGEKLAFTMMPTNLIVQLRRRADA